MTTGTTRQLSEKIAEVCDELKRIKCWNPEAPAWVCNYQKAPETAVEFNEWLQFIYLPNLSQEAGYSRMMNQRMSIVLQAVKFFGEDVKKGKLLQLLVELDSLS